jgi:hypothetical protein
VTWLACVKVPSLVVSSQGVAILTEDQITAFSQISNNLLEAILEKE